MSALDDRRRLEELYLPSADDFVLVDVPNLQFVMIDGEGDPAGAAFAQASRWLFAVIYPIKRIAKQRMGKRYVEPPLEGLWWADDPTDFVERRKNLWHWTMMIMAPDFIGRSLFDAAVEKSTKKLGAQPESLRLELLDEGRALQILHIGSYDDEGPTLAKLHNDVMPSQSLTFSGPHHEIYLSDPHKTEPAKLKTILRQPVKPAGQ